MRATTTSRLMAGAIALVATASLLTACGSDSETADPAASGTTQPGTGAATNGPGGAGPGGMSEKDLAKIRSCLKAAGLEDAMPSGRPSDRPSGMPSDMPSEMPSEMPSDMPSDMPSGAPSGGPGMGGFFTEEVRQALQACGIELPQQPSAPSS